MATLVDALRDLSKWPGSARQMSDFRSTVREKQRKVTQETLLNGALPPASDFETLGQTRVKAKGSGELYDRRETERYCGAEIRQQFAGICEECAGHLLWQHCMLSITAAFANPYAGPI